MRPITRFVTPLIATAILATPIFAAEPDWNQVGQALGKSGSVQAGGAYRVGFPRTDLKVSLDGVALLIPMVLLTIVFGVLLHFTTFGRGGRPKPTCRVC